MTHVAKPVESRKSANFESEQLVPRVNKYGTMVGDLISSNFSDEKGRIKKFFLSH